MLSGTQIVEDEPLELGVIDVDISIESKFVQHCDDFLFTNRAPLPLESLQESIFVDLAIFVNVEEVEQLGDAGCLQVALSERGDQKLRV